MDESAAEQKPTALPLAVPEQSQNESMQDSEVTHPDVAGLEARQPVPTQSKRPKRSSVRRCGTVSS